MSPLFLFLILSVISLSVVIAVPSSRWRHVDRASPNDRLQFTIGLKQTNVDQLEHLLLEVSDPTSPSYGHHLTHQQLLDLISPTKSTINGVIDWLINDGGIPTTSIHHDQQSDWISVEMSVEQAEQLLSTEYHLYQHVTTGLIVTRCLTYTLPTSVNQLIDVIGPTTRFPFIHSKPVKQLLSSSSSSPSAQCDETDPSCIRALYRVGSTGSTSKNNSACVTGYLEQYISLDDLTTFRNEFDPGNKDVPSIIGPNDATNPGQSSEYYILIL